MKMQAVLTALALSATAAFASTTDIASSRRAEFSQAGTHQFYAWCANGQDRVLRQKGSSARDAQAQLAASHEGCRLTWQGRIHA